MEIDIKKEPHPIILSRYRRFNRNYKRKELLGEIINLMGSNGYEDFMFIASGKDGRSVRVGSDDRELRYGDLIWLLIGSIHDLLED